jgi:hypothetical protein
VNNGSWTATAIDTKDFDYCQILVMLGATDVSMAALKVQESDDNSTYTDVVGLRVGTDTEISGSASTLPSATDDNKIWVFDVDCRGRKRYLKLVATAGAGTTGTYLTALAVLSRAQQAPVTASQRGAARILRV